jgi:hypothetical protein
MEPLKQNSFEQEWQQAFENASIPPPNDMWDKIEQELERKKRRPFLFILRPSAVASGIAAALILVLGGLLFFNKNNAYNQKVNAQNISKTSQDVESIKTNKNPTDEESIAKVPNPTQDIPNDKAIASVERPSQIEDNFSLKNKIRQYHLTENHPNKTKNHNHALSKKSTLASVVKLDKKGDNIIAKSENTIAQNTQNQEVLSRQIILENNFRDTFVALNTLKRKEYTYFGSSRTLNRNKLVFDYEMPETQTIASNESKFWLGIQSGVAPFDPNMKLSGLNTFALQAADAFAKVSNSQSSPNLGAMGASSGDKLPAGSVVVSQPQNAIKSGVGINTGFAFGYKIAKKWSIESGIRYLRGNSTLQSNTYAFQQNGYVNTFFADYLLQNSSNNIVTAAQSPINTVVADASQFNNRYEYLMIPMQLGYEIGLSKKLGLNILAGISTDIFLQNTIANDNSFVQEKSTINSTNNIYKPLNISGLGGVRASYLLSKHWQANIGSSYQHSLFSGINSSTALQMRLRMFGVNYGVNYRF